MLGGGVLWVDLGGEGLDMGVGDFLVDSGRILSLGIFYGWS